VTDPHDDNSDIAPSCLRFINSNNVGMVQFELTHQFASYRLDNVGFAEGMVQALHVGEFLYSNSSTPSGGIIFPIAESVIGHGIGGKDIPIMAHLAKCKTLE